MSGAVWMFTLPGGGSVGLLSSQGRWARSTIQICGWKTLNSSQASLTGQRGVVKGWSGQFTILWS